MREVMAGRGIARKSCSLLLAYLGCAIFVLAYSASVGPIAFTGDSFYLCDPAKYFAGRSLPGGQNLFFFYRPLISLLWIPAYFLPRPEDVVLAILAINGLIYASVIGPLLVLLRDYVKLTPRESLWVAFAFALSPCVLIYAPMLLTEAIYAPIFLFLVLATWRRTQSPGFRWDAVCGVLMGLCYLSRHAGSIVPVAWGIAEGTRLLRRDQDWKARLSILKGSVTAVSIAAVPIGLWIGVEHYLAKEAEAGAGASLFAELTAGHDYALPWALNLIQYLLWSPTGFVVLLALLTFLTSPLSLLRDTAAVFVVVTVALAIVSTVFFQASYWGDQSLALNRYLAPYVIPLSVICWRYAPGGRKGYVIGAILVAAAFWMLGFPEKMKTHFPDYLAWTNLLPSGWSGWSIVTHAVFGLGMLGGLACFWSRWKAAALYVVVIFTLFWDVGAAVYWRNFSIGQIQPALESASKVWAATRQDRAALVVDDRSQSAFDREILLFLCFYPVQVPEMRFEDALNLAGEKQKVRLVTRSHLSVGEAFDLKTPVWNLPKNAAVGKAAVARVQALPWKDFTNFSVSNQRERVLLLNEGVSLKIECIGEPALAELRLKVISPKVERTLRITDPAGMSQSKRVTAGTPRAGWQEIRVSLSLQPGINLIKLSVDGPLAKLGRRTTRLALSERLDIRSQMQ